jgi:hypothetical protein
MGEIKNFNYKADPYFADLFQDPTMAKDVFTAFNNQQTYDQKQLQLENARDEAERNDKAQGLQDALAERISLGGMDEAQVLDEYQRLALETGKVDTYLNIAKQKESLKDGNEKENWDKFRLLKDIDPKLAADHFNQTLGSRYGMVNPSNMADLFINDGMVYDKNQLKPGQRIAPPARRGGEADPNKGVAGNEIWVSPDGKNFDYVNKRTAQGLQKALELRKQGWQKDSKSGSSEDPFAVLGAIASKLNGDTPYDAGDEPSAGPMPRPSGVPGPTLPPGKRLNNHVLPSIKR